MYIKTFNVITYRDPVTNKIIELASVAYRNTFPDCVFSCVNQVITDSIIYIYSNKNVITFDMEYYPAGYYDGLEKQYKFKRVLVYLDPTATFYETERKFLLKKLRGYLFTQNAINSNIWHWVFLGIVKERDTPLNTGGF